METIISFQNGDEIVLSNTGENNEMASYFGEKVQAVGSIARRGNLTNQQIIDALKNEKLVDLKLKFTQY